MFPSAEHRETNALTSGEHRFSTEKDMPKTIPFTREHILDAMAYIGSDPLKWPAQSRLKLYVVIDPRNGASLPPKLVLTTAAEIAGGDWRRRPVFSGGEPTNKVLRGLGFSVIEKAPLGNYWRTASRGAG
jgi:hypothetical protein